MGLPLDADPLVVDAGEVLLVLDEPVLPVQLLPLVVLNMIPTTEERISQFPSSKFQS